MYVCFYLSRLVAVAVVGVVVISLLLFVNFFFVCVRELICALGEQILLAFVFLWLFAVLILFILISLLLNIKKNKFYFPEITLTITKIQLYIQYI